MPDHIELDDALLTLVVAAQLPPEEPIMGWLLAEHHGELTDEQRDDLKLRAGDHALVMCRGLVEYHVGERSGVVDLLDHRDPRSMRHQRYDPARPGQPYLPPHVEDRQV